MKPVRAVIFFVVASFFSLSGVFQPAAAKPSRMALTVQADKTLATFIPLNVFGNNVAYWIDKKDNLAVREKVEEAGNYLLRYPGGSASDDYHWNGTGHFDADRHWVPSGDKYSPGFSGIEIYRGTGSSYGTPSNLTDGKTGTSWKSCADTDFPNHQWVYFDLVGKDSAVRVSAVTLVWGKPHASAFQVQAWKGPSGGPAPAQSPDEGDWVTVSSGTVKGKGGTQGVVFTPVETRYLRVLMTQSSGGAKGAYSLAEFYAFNGKDFLTKNVTTMGQTPAVASSTDPACALDKTPSFDFESYMDYLKAFKPRAVPLITINFGTGTLQEAAAWVRYANKVKGYGIKYWEIGNEMEGDWETGGPLNGNDYARRYIQFYEAMKKEDPSILIAGPVACQPESGSNAYNGKTFIQTFLNRLASDPAGSKVSYVNGLSYHCYPYWANSNPVTSLATPGKIAEFRKTLDGWLTAVGAPTDIPVFLTEFNSGNAKVQTVKLVNGLWLVNWLGEFIHSFGERAFTNMWDVLNGGNLSNPEEGDHAYLQVEKNPYQYQERSTYWAMKMMARYWAIAGDSRPHRLVAAESLSPLLKAYGDLRPDGILSLIVVNEDPDRPCRTVLKFKGFTPRSAKAWTFDKENYAWETETKPYHAEPDKPPMEWTPPKVSKSIPVAFKPYSITVLQFTPKK